MNKALKDRLGNPIKKKDLVVLAATYGSHGAVMKVGVVVEEDVSAGYSVYGTDNRVRIITLGTYDDEPNQRHGDAKASNMIVVDEGVNEELRAKLYAAYDGYWEKKNGKSA